MRNKYYILISIIVTLQIIMASNVRGEMAKIKIFVDNKEIVTDTNPFIESGNMLVPVRSIYEALGMDLEWISDKLRVIVNSKKSSPQKKRILLTVGIQSYLIDDKLAFMETSPQIINNRLFTTLQFIGDSTGAKVKWDKDKNIIEITSSGKIPLLKDKRASNPIDMLNGRFNINLPQEFVNEDVASGGKIDPISPDRTRYYLWEHEQLFDVSAQEMYKYSTGNLLNDLKIIMDESNVYLTDCTISDVIKDGELQYIVVKPKVIDNSGENVWLGGTLILLPDNTLASISINVNPFAFTYQEDCILMADNILYSIQKGGRILDTNSKTVNASDYSIEINNGYVYTSVLTDYSEVSYFNKMVIVGQQSPNFSIYSKGYELRYGEGLFLAETKNDIILDHPVIWDIYSSKKGIIDSSTELWTNLQYDDQHKQISVIPINASDLDDINEMLHTMHIMKK